MKITSAQFIKGIRGTDPILEDGVPQIAFVGRSNVGKSSIVSALIDKKAKVKISDRPGKTTEINFFKVNESFYFVDLPGYGYARLSPDEREKLRKLIAWYLGASNAKPEVVLVILDAKAGLTDFDRQMIDILNENEHPHFVVLNKVDKLSQKELGEQLREIRTVVDEDQIVLSSTVAPGGMDALRKALFTDE